MQFRILGPLEVGEHDAVVALGGVKQRAVLAILLLHRGEVVSSERVIDELWGERPPATAMKTLQGYISHLRKKLGEDVLLTRGRGYVLEIAPGEVDLDQFERFAGEGRDALVGGDAATAAECLRSALGLWRGPPLSDFVYEPFAQAEIARLDEVRLAALEDRIDADLALGRHGQLVAELQALVREQPLRERLRSQLMLALYRCGRHADALETYQSGRRALVEELGIEPGRELRELHQAILEQDSRLDVHGVAPSLALTEARPAAVFVGRKRELAELVGAFEDAIVGQGRLCLLTGEPGIGKSRLAEELASRALARGARVLVGRCWEAGGAPAFWPWVQSLRSYVRESGSEDLVSQLGSGAAEIAPILPELYDIVPELPEPAPAESEGARFRLFHATAEFLRRASARRPIVLVLDDLHAADTPSLLLLQFLARELASMHVLLVAAIRDVDPIPDERLTATLAEVTREPVTRRLSLTGLTECDVAEYVGLAAAEIASAELAGMLHAETEGNPLFMTETVRLLSLEGVRRPAGGAVRLAIPQSVRDVISRRLGLLSRECNRLLSLASVLGREFTIDVLAHFGGLSEDELLDALDEAIVARVVGDVPGAAGRVRFAHVLIRDTLYEELTSARRVQLHRRALEALEARYAGEPGPHLAVLAHHSIAANDYSKARDYCARAGDRALALLAYEEAERLYRTALEMLDAEGSSDDRRRCELLLAVGEARARAGASASAADALLEAAAIARKLGLARELARAAADYGGRIVWARAGKDDRLVPLLEEALAALPDDEIELRTRLLSRLAGALRDEPSMQRRDAFSREAVALARTAGSPAALAYALEGRVAAISSSPGIEREQLKLSDEMLAVAERIGDRERMVSAYYCRVMALLKLGEVSDAEANLATATRIAEELRQPAQLWQTTAAWAMLALGKGKLAEAEELMAQALALGEPAQRGMAMSAYTVQYYTLRELQGRLDEAGSTVNDSVVAFPARPLFRCLLVHFHAHRDATSAADRALRDLAADRFAAVRSDLERLYSMSLIAEAIAQLHDAETATVLYELLAPHSALNACETPEGTRGSTSRHLGLLATTLARWDEARAHFEDALAANARIGQWPWLARTQHDYARMLLARNEPGDRDRALDLSSKAHATYHKLGMASWAEKASALAAAPCYPRAGLMRR